MDDNEKFLELVQKIEFLQFSLGRQEVMIETLTAQNEVLTEMLDALAENKTFH